MKVRSTRLEVETLEDRCVPSTVAYGDFNHDGRMDMAAITAPTTVTVRLANPDGSYAVSATLSAPKQQSLDYVNVIDLNGDGNLDVYASGPANGGDLLNYSKWLGNGDGTFDSGTFGKWRWPKGNHGGF